MAEKKAPPAPKPAPKDVQSESSKQEQKNAAADKAQEEGYKRYQEGEKTRLKDQGSSFFNFKNGGTASSRADGCAVRGKTKGRMV
jgi:hypothetical protein